MEDVRAKLVGRLLSSFQDFHYKQQLSEDGVKLSDLSRKDVNTSVEARKKGNQLFTQKNSHNRNIHSNILSEYSKSIAFAPIGSEESALAYSNRSATLLHLQRFEECLIDIDKSMQISKSENLKVKLQARKDNCLELMKYSKQVLKNKVPSKQNKTSRSSQLGFNKIIPSSQMPVASEAISTSYNDSHGRHLVATRDLKAGEIILVERGFICLPKYSQSYLVCNHCLMLAWNGIPCNNCALGIYCSEECKKEAWEEYHEVECSMLPFASFIRYGEYALINILMVAIRMLLKAIKKEGLDAILQEAKADRKEGLEGMTVNGILHGDKFKNFYNLLDHEKSIRKLWQRKMLDESKVIELMIKHTNVFDAAKHSSNGIVESQVILQLEKILGRLIDIIKVNAFGYHVHGCKCAINYGETECECGSSIGTIFASCASLINHSCVPNVSRMNISKGKIVFFTYTPVKKGEQLFDSYGPIVGMPREERRKCLETNFFFTCKCICCEENWFSNSTANKVQNADDKIISKVLNQLQRSFPRVQKASLFIAEKSDWDFDEEQLKMALKMTDLIYKYYSCPMKSLAHSLPCRMYIDMAFNRLFGRNDTVPKDCLSL